MEAEQPKATLRLYLKDELLAYELETVIDVINETYTSLRWLELAEAHAAPGPYGDSTFALDEFLRVPRVDIGTPNFLELYGLYDTLVQTLAYLGTIGGVAGIVKTLNMSLDTANKWTEFRNRPLARQKTQLEIEKLRLEVEAIKAGLKKVEPILEKTIRLNRKGKASTDVVAYKRKRQEAITEKLSYPTVDDAVEGWELIPD